MMTHELSKSTATWAFFFLVCVAVEPVIGAGAAPTSQSSDRVLAEFPIWRFGAIITIPVVWGEKPAYFAFNTGASVNVLDATSFPRLESFDLKNHARAGEPPIYLFRPPDLKVGPFSLADGGPAAHDDLSLLSSVSGCPIIGYIGALSLRDSVVQIDFDERKVRLLRPDTQPHDDWGHALTMHLAGRRPTVSLQAGGAEHEFVIDTFDGSFVALPAELFDHLHDVLKQPVISVPLWQGDIVQVREMRVKNFTVAGSEYHDVILRRSKDEQACLGVDFLERHLVTLDFPNNRAYFKRGKEFERRTEENMSGIHLVRTGNQLVARSIDAGSPAYEAGVREKDVLIVVNGKPANDYVMYDIYHLMTVDGSEMTIEFRRGEIQRRVKFKLRKSI